MQQQQRAHRNAVGPLVKSQSLYLLSSTSGSKHWEFQSNVNSLIKCGHDEVMRVSLASFNVYNSYRQITETNRVLSITPDGEPSFNVRIPPGNYPLVELAALLQERIRERFPEALVAYHRSTNTFSLSDFGASVRLSMAGTLNLILGFSASELPSREQHLSDRSSIPHGVAEIVVELFGLTPVEGAAPLSNYESPSDDVDVGHVLAVVPAGAIWQRTIFNNNSPEFGSFFFSEHSVNTLRIAMVDRQGGAHTWITNPVGISLLFETFKRA